MSVSNHRFSIVWGFTWRGLREGKTSQIRVLSCFFQRYWKVVSGHWFLDYPLLHFFSKNEKTRFCKKIMFSNFQNSEISASDRPYESCSGGNEPAQTSESSYMIITYDDHMWWSLMTILYDHHIWWPYIIIMYDDRIGLLYMMIVYEYHVWSSYTMIIYDHHIWWSYMILV